MKITKEWLFKKNVCLDGLEWFINQDERDSIIVVNKLMDNKKYDWANWLIARLMTRRQRIQYAIYSAEQVIDIFEKKFPKDKRPRQAIDAAKTVLKHDNKRNRAAAAYAATAYDDSTYAAATAAYVAAAYASRPYASYVSYASTNAKEIMQIQLLNYGLSLLKEVKQNGISCD